MSLLEQSSEIIPQPGQEFENTEIEDLQRPIETIIEQMQENIRAGVYSDVIAEDASGRVPGLIMWQVIKENYKEQKMLGPRMHFFAGSTRTTDREKVKKIEDINKIISSWGQNTTQQTELPKNRILIVTEIIDTGEGLTPLVRAIKKSGRTCDIATCCTLFDQTPEVLKEGCVENFFSGGSSLPQVLRKPGLAGVIKSPENIYANAVDKEDEGRKKIPSARRDIKKMVEAIIRKNKKD